MFRKHRPRAVPTPLIFIQRYCPRDNAKYDKSSSKRTQAQVLKGADKALPELALPCHHTKPLWPQTH